MGQGKAGRLFESPDLPAWRARVERVGTTSVTVGVEMYVEELLSRERRLATTGSFVFVAVNEAGSPVPIAAE